MLFWQRRSQGFPPEADPPLGGQIPSAPPTIFAILPNRDGGSRLDYVAY